MSERTGDGWSFSWATLWFALVAGTLVVWLSVLVPVLTTASLDEGARGKMLVVFAPWRDTETVFADIIASGGLPIRTALGGAVWVVEAADRDFVAQVLEVGALGAWRDLPIGVTLAGCTGVIALMEEDAATR